MLPAVVPSRLSDAFTFTATSADGRPVAYDPCRPVQYVVNEAGAPPGSDVLVAGAAERVQVATGLRLVAEGTTEEAPSDRRPPFQPERYGDRWAPVLIAWTDPGEVPGLSGGTAGLGGSTSVSDATGRAVYVTGQVTLDAPQLAELMARPGGAVAVRGVVEHELAHVVGLGHIDDPTQLMNPEGHPGIYDFGTGDLTGLAQLGDGRCVADL